MKTDLFGNSTELISSLRKQYIAPPFSILDTNNIQWKRRKREWKKLGIRGEEGRNIAIYGSKKSDGTDCQDFVGEKMSGKYEHASIFDPVLCEVIYHWFSKEGGMILDPFAGGSVRGIVASVMQREYVGIELRPEQVKANREQGREILQAAPLPVWIEGDSNKILRSIEDETFDLIFSCPPYGNLEVYSKIEGDISNMEYGGFIRRYFSIIRKAVGKLKRGGYAVFVVGEFRDKKTGAYVGFVPDTIRAFMENGCCFYNDIILYTALGTAAFRAGLGMRNKKVCKVHQNVLVFRKE